MTTPEQLETRMLRDRAAIRDEQLAQAQENALLLYQALAKHAPDALAEIKPRLHANIREMDKVVCEVTAAREEAARLRREVDALETENARLQEVAQEVTKEYLALRLNLAAAKHEAEKLVREEKERHRGPVLSKEVIDKFLGDDHGQ